MKWIIFIFLSFSISMFSQNTFLLDKGNSLLPDNDLTCIAVDQNGIKWVGSSKFGLISFNDSVWTVYDQSNSPIKGNYISNIEVDKKGKIWFSFSQPEAGLGSYDGKEFIIYTTKNSELPDDSIITIVVDEQNNKWIGTSKGIVKYDDKEWTTFTEFNKAMNNTIMDISLENDSTIWVATTTGLVCYGYNVKERFSRVNHVKDPNSSKAVNTLSSAQDPDMVYTIVEKRPQFPGGDEKLLKFINKNMQYPSIAAKNGLQGTVYVEFIVEKDGSISNVNNLQFSTEFDAEAIRLIKSMPKWIPGEQNDKTVRVKQIVPIKFALNR